MQNRRTFLSRTLAALGALAGIGAGRAVAAPATKQAAPTEIVTDVSCEGGAVVFTKTTIEPSDVLEFADSVTVGDDYVEIVYTRVRHLGDGFFAGLPDRIVRQPAPPRK